MCRPMPWLRNPIRKLALDDVETYYYRRINELPNAKDRLRLKSLLAQVKLDLGSIPES